MPRPPLLPESEIRTALATSLPGWILSAGALHKEFRFHDFVSAFQFMTRGALVAERLNHHPDWRNVYGRVEVTLSTHDRGGVTALDLELAAELEKGAPPARKEGE